MSLTAAERKEIEAALKDLDCAMNVVNDHLGETSELQLHCVSEKLKKLLEDEDNE